MTRLRIYLVTLSLMVFTASLASASYATCPDCLTQDWASSANNFLEGIPINDIPSSLSTPQQNRLKNTFKSNLLKTNTSKPANNTNNQVALPTLNTSTLSAPTLSTPTTNTPTPDTSTPGINLNSVKAMPNPVDSGSPVMINVSFGSNSSNPQDISKTNITAHATIKDDSGLKVGIVDLKHTSGEEYAGIWNANTMPGVYKATIVASESGTSKTFADALLIEVSESKK